MSGMPENDQVDNEDVTETPAGADDENQAATDTETTETQGEGAETDTATDAAEPEPEPDSEDTGTLNIRKVRDEHFPDAPTRLESGVLPQRRLVGDDVPTGGLFENSKVTFDPAAKFDENTLKTIVDAEAFDPDKLKKELDDLDGDVREQLSKEWGTMGNFEQTPREHTSDAITADGGTNSGGSDEFLPAEENPIVNERVTGFITSVISPLNAECLNTWGDNLAHGVGAPTTNAVEEAFLEIGKIIGDYAPTDIHAMYSTSKDKWGTDLTQSRQDLLEATVALGQQISKEAAPAYPAMGRVATNIAEAFGNARMSVATQIARTNQAIEEYKAKHTTVSSTPAGAPLGGTVPKAELEAASREAVEKYLNLDAVTHELTNLVRHQAITARDAARTMIDGLVNDGTSTKGGGADTHLSSDSANQQKQSGDKFEGGKPSGTATPAGGGGGGGAVGGGGRIGGGGTSTIPQVGGSAAGAPGMTSSGGRFGGITREKAGRIAGALEGLIDKKMGAYGAGGTALTGGGAGMPMPPGMMNPAAPNFLPMPEPPTPPTSSPLTGLTGGGGLGGMPQGLGGAGAMGGNPGGLGGLGGLLSGGMQPGFSSAAPIRNSFGGSYNSPGGQQAQGGTTGTQPRVTAQPVSDTTTGPAHNQPGAQGVSPREVPRGGGAGSTITLEGLDVDVTVPDEDMANVVRHIAEHANGDNPLGLEEAAKAAGYPDAQLGEYVDDLGKAEPGMAVMGDKGNGIYLGDGDVLMEDGTLKHLTEVLKVRPPEQGFFELELGEFNPDAVAEDSDADVEGEGDGAPGVDGEPDENEGDADTEGGEGDELPDGGGEGEPGEPDGEPEPAEDNGDDVPNAPTSGDAPAPEGEPEPAPEPREMPTGPAEGGAAAVEGEAPPEVPDMPNTDSAELHTDADNRFHSRIDGSATIGPVTAEGYAEMEVGPTPAPEADTSPQDPGGDEEPDDELGGGLDDIEVTEFEGEAIG